MWNFGGEKPKCLKNLDSHLVELIILRLLVFSICIFIKNCVFRPWANGSPVPIASRAKCLRQEPRSRRQQVSTFYQPRIGRPTKGGRGSKRHMFDLQMWKCTQGKVNARRKRGCRRECMYINFIFTEYCIPFGTQCLNTYFYINSSR